MQPAPDAGRPMGLARQTGGNSIDEIGLRYRKKATADGQTVSYARPDFMGRVLALASNSDTPQQVRRRAPATLLLHACDDDRRVAAAVCDDQQNWADETEQLTNRVLAG